METHISVYLVNVALATAFAAGIVGGNDLFEKWHTRKGARSPRAGFWLTFTGYMLGAAAGGLTTGAGWPAAVATGWAFTAGAVAVSLPVRLFGRR